MNTVKSYTRPGLAFLSAAADLEARLRLGEDVVPYVRSGAVLLYDRTAGFVARYDFEGGAPVVLPEVDVVYRDEGGREAIARVRYDASMQRWLKADGGAIPRDEASPVGVAAVEEPDDFDPDGVLCRLTFNKREFGIMDARTEGDTLSLMFLSQEDAASLAQAILTNIKRR